MKKILYSLFILLFGVQTAFSANIDVLPTMTGHSNVQDRVWAGTFQIVWNDLMDKYAYGTIRFAEGTPDIAKELNKQGITSDDFSERCYYKYAGKLKKDTKKTLVKAIRKEFDETSDMLNKLDLTPNKQKYIIYAMLKKDFKFSTTFDKLGVSDFKNTPAEFFGITQNSDDGLKKGVKVLFYNSPDDYAVALNTAGKDEVYLYKTSNTKQFHLIYSDMLKKQLAFNGKTVMNKNDELKVPNLRFFEEKQFDELTEKRIKGTRFQIDKALETIKFEMTNEGEKQKNKSNTTTVVTSSDESAEEAPRYFYFDDTFVIFLKEKEKSIPYFALRVYDIRNYQ